MTLLPYDRDALRDRFRGATPFPFVEITPFLEPEFADMVAADLPSFRQSQSLGREFATVNEQFKVQITLDPRFQ